MRRLQALCLCMLLTAGRAAALDEPLENFSGGGMMTTGCSIQYWRVKGLERPKIYQVSFPVTLSMPVGQKVGLSLSTAAAFSKADDRNKVSSLSDTWVQGNFLIGKNALLNLGVGVPTGKVRLSNTEFTLITDVLSRNIYRFQVPVYGQGFCGRIGGAAAFPLGRSAILGLGAQYLMRSSYKPFQWHYEFSDTIPVFTPFQHDSITHVSRYLESPYRPGNEWSVLAGVDIRVGENTKLMFDADFTQYDKDLLDGSVVFKAGTKISGHAGVFTRFDERFFSADFTYRFRGKHEELVGLALEPYPKTLLGSQMELDVTYKAVAFREGGFFLLGDFRIYQKNDFKVDGASLYGVGMGVHFPMSENVFGDLRGKIFAGSLKNEVNQDVLGTDIRFGIQCLF
jgi:hypothetical protein